MISKESLVAISILCILISVVILLFGKSKNFDKSAKRNGVQSILKFAPLASVAFFCIVLVVLNIHSGKKQDMIVKQLDSIKLNVDTLNVHDPASIAGLSLDEPNINKNETKKHINRKIDSINTIYDSSIAKNRKEIVQLKNGLSYINNLAVKTQNEQYYTGNTSILDSLKNLKERYNSKISAIELSNQKYSGVKTLLDTVKSKYKQVD